MTCMPVDFITLELTGQRCKHKTDYELQHLILTSVTWHLQFISHFYYIYIHAKTFMYKISDVYNLHTHMRNWRYNKNNNNNNCSSSSNNNNTKLFLCSDYFILFTIHAHGETDFLAMVNLEHDFHHPE
jgi:hypothetical protein